MDNINDILRAKRIVRQNGYRIEKPARDYDYEREDRMNLIRAKRIVRMLVILIQSLCIILV